MKIKMAQLSSIVEEWFNEVAINFGPLADDLTIIYLHKKVLVADNMPARYTHTDIPRKGNERISTYNADLGGILVKKEYQIQEMIAYTLKLWASLSYLQLLLDQYYM